MEGEGRANGKRKWRLARQRGKMETRRDEGGAHGTNVTFPVLVPSRLDFRGRAARQSEAESASARGRSRPGRAHSSAKAQR